MSKHTIMPVDFLAAEARMIAQQKYDGIRKAANTMLGLERNIIEIDYAGLERRAMYALLYGMSPQMVIKNITKGVPPMKKTYASQAIAQRVKLDNGKCPVHILKAIRQNEGFKCEARDDSDSKWVPFVVTGYNPKGGTYRYSGYTTDGASSSETDFQHVRWVIEEPRMIVKSKVEILEDLLRRGYTLSPGKECYRNIGCYDFRMMMFDSCGQEPSSSFTWSDYWLEPVGSSQEVFNTQTD